MTIVSFKGGYNSQVSELNAQLKNLTKQLEAKGYVPLAQLAKAPKKGDDSKKKKGSGADEK